MVCYNCGSKEHLYRECPHPKKQNYAPQYPDPGQQQGRYSPKGAGRGAPKGQQQPHKGDKDGKGKGKKGKDDAKNPNHKGKGGKRQAKPGAKAAQDWNPDHQDYSTEDYGYGQGYDDYSYYPPEEQEQETETAEPHEEEPYDYEEGWNGQYGYDEPEESEPPENNESVVKTVVAIMQKCAENLAKEQQENPFLSSLALEGRS